jgi:hypothetical protein
VDFHLEQVFAAEPDAVAAAYADPLLYAAFEALPKMGRPELVGHSRELDVVTLQVRYAFAGELSSAARAVLDPARLTWVERSRHDLAERSVTFTLVADHYADRFTASGRYRFVADGDGTRRIADGTIKVKALLVASAVERAIISGLHEQSASEVAVVESFIAGRG